METARMVRLGESAPYTGPRLTPAQRALAESWIRFAFKEAIKYAARVNYGQRVGRVDIDDLQSAALAATCEAAMRFDPTRASTMGALLGLMLRQKLHHEVCRQKAAGFSRCQSNLTQGRLGFEEIPSRYCLETPVGEGLTVKDVIPGHMDECENEDLTALRQSIKVLPDRLREVVVRRLNGDTLDEIARDHGVCKERIRQLELQARARLADMIIGVDPDAATCGQCGARFRLTPQKRVWLKRGGRSYCSPACGRAASRIKQVQRRLAAKAGEAR